MNDFGRFLELEYILSKSHSPHCSNRKHLDTPTHNGKYLSLHILTLYFQFIEKQGLGHTGFK